MSSKPYNCGCHHHHSSPSEHSSFWEAVKDRKKLARQEKSRQKRANLARKMDKAEANRKLLYIERAKMLKFLGFSSYHEYLKSELWAGIRAKVLIRDGYTCQMCGNKATQVHHKNYTLRVLSGRGGMSQLVSTCGDCHTHIEFVGDHKTTLLHANRRLVSKKARKRHTDRLALKRKAHPEVPVPSVEVIGRNYPRS